MAAQQSLAASEAARKSGNELYIAHRFQEAIGLYQQASDLAPETAAPLGNLSAAYFELGQYDACVSTSDRALALLANVAGADAAKQKLYLRQAKALFHGLRFKDAAATIEQLTAGEEKSRLQHATSRRLDRTRLQPDGRSIHTRLITELPRYKPTVRTEAEYYVVGHDIPKSLYDPKLRDSDRKSIALLFGGIGDARNLHATLIGIAGDVQRRVLPDEKAFHITINDIKPAAIARDLVIFVLLSDFASALVKKNVSAKGKIMACLYYTYLAPIMPARVYDALQERIQRLIDMLEERIPLLSFLDVPQPYRSEVIRLLEEWQGEAAEKYPAARLRSIVVVQRREDEARLMMLRQTELPSPGCAAEAQLYRQCGILLMPAPYHKLYEKEMRAATEELDVAKATRVAVEMGNIADAHWRPNVTQIDLKWLRVLEADRGTIDIAHDPFEFAERILMTGLPPPKNLAGLFSYTSAWFSSVGASIELLRGKIMIEACVGDVTAVLEQVRYGIVGHRQAVFDGSSEGRAPAENTYPTSYDRIHLSNIPDYVGGSLTTFLYALPVTQPGTSSYATSTNLRNPPRFKTHASYHNEYIALHEPADLAKTFQVRMGPRSDPGEGMPTATYNKWHHEVIPTGLTDLLPREKLETWLFRLLLKISTPARKDDVLAWQLVYAPLNLTVFFRICKYLHTAGYPAHWLSSILDEILSGKITTIARPPRSEPLALKESRSRLPPLRQSLTPFVAEFTTLVSIWESALPFSIMTTHVAPLHVIHKYSVAFRCV